MHRTTSRRIGIGTAGVAALTLTLTGCSGSGNVSTELSDEPVTLSVAWWGGDARAALTEEAIDAFEDEYPNITVETQFGEWGGYWDQLATSTAAGDAPDIVQMDETYLASYASRGALLDLDQVDFDTSGMPDELVESGRIDGALYAAPIGVNVFAVVANTDLFEQYGVELPDDETWTWDDYASIATELTEKSGGAIHGTTQVGGYDSGSVRYWGRSAGQEIFDGTEVVLEPEVLSDMWQYELDLIESGGMESASAIVESQAAGIGGGSLATGKVAMGLFFNTQITALSEASGANLELLKLPEPEEVDPNFYKPSMFWSVSARAEHPAEAALLIDFLVNKNVAAEIIKTERGVPANDSMRELIEPSLAPTDQAAVAYQDRVQPGGPFFTPSGAATLGELFSRYSQEVLSGQTSPEAAAEAALAELQTEVASAN